MVALELFEKYFFDEVVWLLAMLAFVVASLSFVYLVSEFELLVLDLMLKILFQLLDQVALKKAV